MQPTQLQNNTTAASERGTNLRLALPKGRMQEGVARLLDEAGLSMSTSARSYRPRLDIDGIEAKLLKPQNIIEMLEAGSRDIGFAGADWVEELDVDLVELLDTGLDPVRLVAAAPRALLVDGQLPDQPLTIASEYVNITQRWIKASGLNARVVRSFGATEVFPPEDADCIVDNTATGSTLRANDLAIVDLLARSTTRLYANPAALDDPDKRTAIEGIVMLIDSVLQARRRVMVEVNVPNDKLDDVIDALPSMGEPTIATLYRDSGYAVKAAILRSDLATVIPLVRQRGGTDIVVTRTANIVA